MRESDEMRGERECLNGEGEGIEDKERERVVDIYSLSILLWMHPLMKYGERYPVYLYNICVDILYK